MIKAVIFDMDGVISDTQTAHARIESEMFGRFGVDMSPAEVTVRFAGVSEPVFFREVLAGTDADIEELLREKWERMIGQAGQHVPPIPGALELIEGLSTAGLKLGVASASVIEYVNTVLNKLNIMDKFGTVISADEVEHGKPAPDVFLLAARRLGAEPPECLVIEDGRSGMIGAKRAGMKCIGLVGDMDKDWPADLIINSLTELTPEKIINL